MKSSTLILRQHNLRSTPVRRAVVSVLAQASSAKSAQELEALTDADRITMYRTLQTFESTGIVHRIFDGTGVDKFALCAEDCSAEQHVHNHAHFNCERCGDTKCLPSVPTTPAVLPKGYQLNEIQLTYRGLCRNCHLAQA